LKVLVVCCSRSGRTRQVAQEIVGRQNADLETITDSANRCGQPGYVRCVWQSLTHAAPPIRPAHKDPGAYELVIIDTPICAYGLTSPVRTYARQHASRFRRVAFFCTEGAAGHLRAFGELRRLCGNEPPATLVVTEAELLPESTHAARLDRFVTGLAAP